MAETSTQSGGIGVVGLLGVVFVTLKLTGVINWSWWYVTMPFWIGGVVVLLLILVAIVSFLVKEWISYRRRA
jgi:hypothetical protein